MDPFDSPEAKMSQRYEKEIEEILKNAGDSPTEERPSDPSGPPPERLPGRKDPPRRKRSVSRSLSLGYKHLLGAGIIALVASLFFGGVPMLLIGAALLAAGYFVYYRAPRSGGGNGSGGRRSPKVWRGRTIDPGDEP